MTGGCTWVAVITDSVAAVLLTEPTLFVTRTTYAPSSARETFERVSEDEVAPFIAAPFRVQTYCTATVEEATTENRTLEPSGADWLAGWVVMTGGCTWTGCVTVTVAALLATEPALFVTTTE
jgi:hypothetical protein